MHERVSLIAGLDSSLHGTCTDFPVPHSSYSIMFVHGRVTGCQHHPSTSIGINVDLYGHVPVVTIMLPNIDY